MRQPHSPARALALGAFAPAGLGPALVQAAPPSQQTAAAARQVVSRFVLHTNVVDGKRAVGVLEVMGEPIPCVFYKAGPR